jgi:hypothetical protein
MNTPLEDELRQLEKSPIAPSGCWIETGKCSKREWRQTYWRSETPCFVGKRGGMTRRKYIGKEGSPQHQEAIEAVQRRERISKIRAIIRVGD